MELRKARKEEASVSYQYIEEAREYHTQLYIEWHFLSRAGEKVCPEKRLD